MPSTQASSIGWTSWCPPTSRARAASAGGCVRCADPRAARSVPRSSLHHRGHRRPGRPRRRPLDVARHLHRRVPHVPAHRRAGDQHRPRDLPARRWQARTHMARDRSPRLPPRDRRCSVQSGVWPAACICPVTGHHHVNPRKERELRYLRGLRSPRLRARSDHGRPRPDTCGLSVALDTAHEVLSRRPARAPTTAGAPPENLQLIFECRVLPEVCLPGSGHGRRIRHDDGAASALTSTRPGLALRRRPARSRPAPVDATRRRSPCRRMSCFAEKRRSSSRRAVCHAAGRQQRQQCRCSVPHLRRDVLAQDALALLHKPP